MDELANVLIEKKLNPESIKMVIECFNDVVLKYGDNSKRLANFISSIKKIKSIKYSTDFKIDDNYGDLSLFFGEGLKGINIKGDIFLFSQDKTTLIHEIEHSNQEGFSVPSQHFGSHYLFHTLREGDAVSASAGIYYDEVEQSIHDNAFAYPDELYFFQSIKLIMGDEFMEKWKHDESKKDYLDDVRNRFTELGITMFFHKIVGLNFLISYIYETIEKKRPLDLSIIKDSMEYELETIEMSESNILSRKNQIAFNERRIENMKLDIKAFTEMLTSNKVVSQEEIDEATADLELAEEHLKKFRSCNGDKEKIKDFIESLSDEYDETLPYEDMILDMIRESKEVLDGTYLEKKIISKKENILKCEEDIKILQNNNEEINENIVKVEKDLVKRKNNLEIIEFVSRKSELLDGTLENSKAVLNTLRLELQIFLEYTFEQVKDNFDLDLYDKIITSSPFNKYSFAKNEQEKNDTISRASILLKARIHNIKSATSNLDDDTIAEKMINNTYSKLRIENPLINEEAMTR